MAFIVFFNGTQYDLARIRTQAGQTHEVEVKRKEAVLDPGDVGEGELAAPYLKAPLATTSRDAQDLHNIANVIESIDKHIVVYQHGGKFYFLLGLERALERFKESDVIKARVLTKHMLKKCAVGYEGGKIVAEVPESPRRSYSSNRDDWSRPKYNRDR